MGSDLLLALRMLRNARVYATTAIVTLAVCIGANAAIFTIVNSVLLQPLSVPDARPAWLELRRPKLHGRTWRRQVPFRVERQALPLFAQCHESVPTLFQVGEISRRWRLVSKLLE